MIMVQSSNMRHMSIICFGMMIALVYSCNMKPCFEVVVEHVKLFDSIPSGSGLIAEGDSVFIIGDDATSLYQLSLSTNAFVSIPLINITQLQYRIKKPDKHDLESLSFLNLNGKKYIASFGSGSVSPQRDSLLLVSADDFKQQQWISLGNFYTRLRKISVKNELNIEGAVSTSENVYLFNRSGSEVYELSLKLFEAIMQSKINLMDMNIKKYQFDLPASEGVQSALSGGCLFRNDAILFCASAENLPNVYDDGDIQGSYVGIISINKKGLALKELTGIKDKSGAMLKDKLESIDIAGHYSNGDVRAFAIADNDDGKSKLFELRIKYTSIK